VVTCALRVVCVGGRELCCVRFARCVVRVLCAAVLSLEGLAGARLIIELIRHQGAAAPRSVCSVSHGGAAGFTSCTFARCGPITFSGLRGESGLRVGSARLSSSVRFGRYCESAG
jgi:hypothetical protein